MPEHLSDGKFASKDVTGAARAKSAGKRVRGRPFQPGNKFTRAGVPNKTTRAVKEFLAALVDEPDVQDAVKARIMKGDAVAFFRALEQVIGKPTERQEIEHSGSVTLKHELSD